MQRPALLFHENTIDGSKAIVWQQTDDVEYPFSLQKGAFDAIADHSAGGGVSMMEFNCDADFIAVVVADSLKAVWIWQPDHPEPHTIILFQDNIQQLLWHPKRPDILLVTTSQKTPEVYVWYSEAKSPLPCSIPLPNAGSIKYQGQWLSRDICGRHPFMMTTTKSLALGMLEEVSGTVVFKSLLHNELVPAEMDDHEDTPEEISTPSKPDKKGSARGNLHVLQGRSMSQIQPADASRW